MRRVLAIDVKAAAAAPPDVGARRNVFAGPGGQDFQFFQLLRQSIDFEV